MKRTDFFIKLTTAVFFLAVVSYIGVYLYNAIINTYVTASAFTYSVEDTYAAQGYIVRTESTLKNTGGAVLPIVGDGEKVASGQAIAVEYTSSDALETASELRTIRLRIAQLEKQDSAAAGAANFDTVMALSTAVQSGDLSGLDELAMNVETDIFVSGSVSGDTLESLQARRAQLESQSLGLNTIYAPVSGIFSQTTDGFEGVAPSSLSGITPSGLTALFSAQPNSNGIGKLVTEFTWYYAAIMDASEAMRLPVGQQIPVRFSGAYRTQVDMRVESVGRKEDGNCVVLFSSDRSIQDIAPLRYIRADVITDVISGIRVPKEAIHLDDNGSAFIFLQTGVRAERVDVEILTDIGDSYLVRDGAENGTPLREGATIIVKANNLYDGKIVA